MKDFSAQPWAPFLVSPRFSNRPWGVSDLRPWFEISAKDEPIGEAWLTGDECTILSGPHAGQKLGSLFASHPAEMLGTTAHAGSPLLIKLIFASEKLSVQVHPDDAMAQKYGEPRGKTECWYLLETKPGAQLAVGLKEGVTLEAVKQGIEKGTLEESLNLLTVTPGDMIFVDAGTVHAIWPGVVVLEAQQNCDLTYRMYDYGRPRELHVEKSLEATKFGTRAGKVAPVVMEDRARLMESEYFRLDRIPVKGSKTSQNLRQPDEAAAALSYLFVLAGSGKLVSSDGSFEPLALTPCAVAAIPAAAGAFTVEGELELVRISPRWPEQA